MKWEPNITTPSGIRFTVLPSTCFRNSGLLRKLWCSLIACTGPSRASAASSAASAASRYFSICTLETSSAAPMLSKPSATPSSGSMALSGAPMENKSCSVFSYSTRFSRRYTTRPSPACRASEACCNCARNAAITGCNSADAGRAFFFGGISPCVVLSKTFTHAANAALSAKSVDNASSCKPPFFASAS